MNLMDLRNEDGWMGAFTRQQAEGALKNGTRIVKTNSELGDGHPDGTPGVVLGSFKHPDMGDMMLYFVEWAPKPRVAIGTLSHKVREAA